MPLSTGRFAGIKLLIVLTSSLLLLGACAAAPSERKAKFLRNGQDDFKKAKYQEAVIEFRNAIQIDPRFADAHFRLALAYSSLGSREAAYRELLSAVTLDAKNWDAELELASALIARHDYDGAESIAQKVLQANPGKARAHEILAEKFTITRNFPAAETELRKSIELAPKRVETYAALGSVFRAEGNKVEAENTYTKAIEINPKSLAAHVAAAQFFFSEGRMRESEAELRKACGLDPKAIQPRLYLGRVLTASGHLPQAEELYQDLKSLAPDNPDTYRALGIFYLSTHQKEKAAAEFQSLLRSKHVDMATKGYLVETLIGLTRFKDAAKYNSEILDKIRDDPQALLASGRISIAQGKYEEARTALEKLVHSQPKSAEGYYLLGVTQRVTGFSELAKASFSRAHTLSPKSHEPAVGLAGIGLTRGENDEALRQSGEALKLNPESPQAHLANARALSGKGSNQKALAQLDEILERDPASLPALGTWMKISIEQGRSREATDRILALLQQDPRNASLHFLLGVGFAGLKDLPRAEASVNQAVSLDPKTPDAYSLLASIDFAEGKADIGKENLRAAIRIFPRALSNYTTLATQYEKERNWAEATRLWEKAHEIDPDAPMVAAELAFLYLEHGGDVNLAVKLAQTAKQKMPDSAAAADCLGWAYYKLGSVEPAIQQLRISNGKSPDNPMYQYHLAMAYLAVGQIDSCERLLTAAIRHQPNFLEAASARAALEKVVGKNQ